MPRNYLFQFISRVVKALLSRLPHFTEYTLESFGAEMAAAALLVIHQEVRWGEIWAEAVPETSAKCYDLKTVEKRHVAGC